MHEQAASLVLFPSVRPLFSPPFLSRAAAAAWVVGTAVLSQNSRIRSHSSTKRRRRKGKRVHIITGVAAAARYFEPLFSPADGMVLDGWF